jgi:DNA-binding NarL/FixJ family response regulator
VNTAQRPIRVVLVDDQAVARNGFRAILDPEPDIEVVDEAGDGRSGIAAVRRSGPDVVLMDVRMPGMDGIEATRRLAGPGVSDPVDVLIVTTFDLDEYVFAALREGAAGFLLKDAKPDDIVAAVRTVAAGDGLVAPQVTRRLIAEFARSLPPADAEPAAAERLTDREHEVLECVSRGWSNKEIGAHLHLEESTVKTHVRNVLTKLGLRDRVQAVVYAYEHGLAHPSR